MKDSLMLTGVYLIVTVLISVESGYLGRYRDFSRSKSCNSTGKVTRDHPRTWRGTGRYSRPHPLGISFGSRLGRIVMGQRKQDTKARQGEFPSFVALKPNVANPNCGATIIDACTVLTAGHCLYDAGRPSPDRVKIQVGDHTVPDAATEMTVRNYTIHPRFYKSRGTYDNDLTILKVDPINFARIPFSAPTKLASPNLPYNGRECKVVGVGALQYKGPSPRDYILQEVVVPTWEGVECERSSDIRTTMSDPQNQLCAGGPNGDSCEGDSGGPLYCEENGAQVLSGVVSYGRDCALAGYPGVYVRVANYRDFIRQHSGC